MTLIIYNQIEEPLRFICTEENVEELDGVWINSSTNSDEQQDKLNAFVYDLDGNFIQKYTEKFPIEKIKQIKSVIICGFLP